MCSNAKEVRAEGDIRVHCSNQVPYSRFLMKLNSDANNIGDYVFSAWSKGLNNFFSPNHAFFFKYFGVYYHCLDDEVLNYEASASSPTTAFIPQSTGHKIYSKFIHMETKEETIEGQFNMVVNHVI